MAGLSPMEFYSNPNRQYFLDVNQERLFTRNDNNYINRLGRDVLDTLGDVSMLDIYLSNGRVVEPHYHPNAAELVYCITGSVVVSFINPFTNERKDITITPGEVANIPKGWWHWEEASEDQTHLLAIFDAPYPQYILGSDILTKTPVEVMAHTYCLDPDTFSEAIAPIGNQSIVIGPTDACIQNRENRNSGIAEQEINPEREVSNPEEDQVDQPIYQQNLPQYTPAHIQPLGNPTQQPNSFPNQSHDWENQQYQGQPEIQSNWHSKQQPYLLYPQMNQVGTNLNFHPQQTMYPNNSVAQSHLINEYPQQPRNYDRPVNNFNGGPVYYYPNPNSNNDSV
ncbi:cupin domain-containing protein [Oceanobacillus kimchii]|nr:cupin domain-containing protein [Oceanobacillus kimchii]MCT2134628.1 cupin domain-containing protein [Oceanobacillus kimchii]